MVGSGLAPPCPRQIAYFILVDFKDIERGERNRTQGSPTRHPEDISLHKVHVQGGAEGEETERLARGETTEWRWILP